MKTCIAMLVASVAVTGRADAHALDEYVQALRVGVSLDRIELFLDLTPGMNIAADVVRHVDADGDGVVTPNEAQAYGSRVISDLRATLDDHTVALTLTRVEVPTLGELRSGAGVIRVEALLPAAQSRGHHRLRIENRHLPALSVYLANALLPDTPRVSVGRQTRDERQQIHVLDYDVHAGYRTQAIWLMAGFGAVGLLVHVRTRR
jgi:hypothetical protein